MVSIKPWDYTLIDIAQIFFKKSTKRRLALIDLIRDYIFLIRFDSTYTLFFTAVILFYSIICTPLSTVPFQRS